MDNQHLTNIKKLMEEAGEFFSDDFRENYYRELHISKENKEYHKNYYEKNKEKYKAYSKQTYHNKKI